ncbi:amidohydrolase family protein [soil metagenome]
MYQPEQMIDAHQHLWLPSERHYPWLEQAGPPLEADFGPEDVASDIAAAGITGTVLVQSADSFEDTFYMVSVAQTTPTVVGVVGWAPLDRPAEAAVALDLYARAPVIRGIRVLNHDYDDPRWLLRPEVTAGIELLAPRGYSLDVVSTIPEHLASFPELARRHPELTIVIDHLAKPDVAGAGWEPWASLLADAAAEPNVSIKISGLATSSAPGWTFQDWQRYVDHAIAVFGSGRIMLGSDWPVSTLAGDFGGVWMAQREVISALSEAEQDDILFRTATRSYRLEDTP